MAEDIKMNSFSQATDAAYIYGELSNGSQVKIKKEDLANIIESYLGKTIRAKAYFTTSLNDEIASFGYNGSMEDGSGITGPYISAISDKEGANGIQIKVNYSATIFKIRICSNNKFSEWRSVTLT